MALSRVLFQFALFASHIIPLIGTGVYNKGEVCHTVHFIASFATCVHVSYGASIIIASIVKTWSPLLNFYDQHIQRCFYGSTTILLFVPYYVVIITSWLFKNGRQDVLDKTFTTIILIIIFATFIQVAHTTLLVRLFKKHHEKRFQELLEVENALTLHGTLGKVTEVLDCITRQRGCEIRKYQALKIFVMYWTQRNDEEILYSLTSKTQEVFDVLRIHIDRDNDNIITYEEFEYALRSQLGEGGSHVAADIWNLLIPSGIRDVIDKDVIEHVLYHMLFQKKYLAHAIDTDITLVNWSTLYCLIFLTPVVGIIISSIWGYESAFNGSFNLMQINILVTTFIVNKLWNNIRFMTYMLIVRPFNVGEILYVEGDVYRVIEATPTYIRCVGSDTVVFLNSQIVQSSIHNYSRSHVKDMVRLELTMNAGNEVVDILYQAMHTYATVNWKEIDKNGLRCGWVTLQNGSSKIVQCNWTYNFTIYNRDRYNRIRTQFVNYLISQIVRYMTNHSMLINAAQGGALNEFVNEHYKSTLHSIK